ncbi:hypothetical protein Tco_0594217 [Tanacetum coccineum]
MIKDRQFDGRSRVDLYKHIAEFVEICGMFRYGNTNADAIKLKLFPSSLAGEAKIWFNELSSGAYAFHQDKASLVRVPVANVTMSSSAHLLRENTDSVRCSLGPVFLLGLSAFSMAAACASRAVVKSAISYRRASKVMAGVLDVDVLLGGIR